MTRDDFTRRIALGIGTATLGALTLPGAASAPAMDRPIKLSLNENTFGPSSLAKKAIIDGISSIDRYVGGEARALEQQIAAHEGVSPDQIILGEILDALGLQLALTGAPGGEFIYSEPGYTALVNAVAPGGGVVVGVPLNAALQNDLDAIAARVTAKARAIYLINPHNPSGTVTPPQIFKPFLRQMANRTIMIVDEAYLEYEPDFVTQTAVDLVRDGANVIVFRTFAKIYGLAGLAMGYAVMPKALAKTLKDKELGAPHELNRLALAAASASLRDTGFAGSVRDRVLAERQLWNTMLDRLGRPHSDSRGNFVFFDRGRPHDQFATAMLAQSIEVARSFPPSDHWGRITIGLPHENAAARTAVARID